MVRDILFLTLCICPILAAQAQEARLDAEVAAARNSLQEHPKFKKYYEHLAANPDTLPVNGPKLAVLLAAEAKTSAAIKDHAPSLLATWQEVVRLAAAGNDYKTAFPAIDSLQKHPSGLLPPATARATKGKLLAAAAEANATKPAAGEREALLELVRPLLKDSLATNDVEALPSLLTADTKLSWSTTESANSIQLLLPLAEQAVENNRPAAAKLLFDHLDALVLKTAAGKSRKDFADAIGAARERLKTIESAEAAQQTLATKPLDPAANQTYGRYLLACGQAKESLTYLALGSDAEWKKLAADSLEVKTATDKVALADRWSALGKYENASSKEIARHFYQEALADKSLVGVPRATAEEKMKALGPAPVAWNPSSINSATVNPAIASAANKPLPLNEWTELLPLIDFDQDLQRGFFSRGPRDSVIIDKSPWARLRMPVLLEDCSYDLAVEFQVADEAHNVHLVLPVSKGSVALFVDGSTNNLYSFFNAPKAARIKGDFLKPQRAHRYDVAVRLQDNHAQTILSIDGAKIVEHECLAAELKAHSYSLSTNAQPGLAGFESQAIFTSCKVRPITGTATIGRDVPLIKPIPASVLALKATSLTTLRPVATKFTKDWYGVNRLPGPQHPPVVGGAVCGEYLFAHAPASMTFAIPPKTKYFTAVAYCALSCDVNFIVRIDGKEVVAVARKAVAPVVVEIPEGAKEMELVCDPLGNQGADHSFWCFPAFRQ